MSSAASRLIQKIKPHIPLIKFRKGGLPGTLAAPAMTPSPSAAAAAFVQEAAAAPLAAAAAAPPPSSAFKAAQMPVREWWDTPARFKRRQVDLTECDLINGGGCDKLYQ